MLTQCQSLLIEFLSNTFEILLVLSILSSAKSGWQGDAMSKSAYVIGCHLSIVPMAGNLHEPMAARRTVLEIKYCICATNARIAGSESQIKQTSTGLADV